MRNDCLFCAIIDGEVEGFKVYEDDLFLVILDRFPKCVGHTLIMPKRHAVHIFDLNDKECAHLFPLTQKISAVLQEILGFSGLNLLQNNGPDAGQEIGHFHLHLVPRFEDDAMSIQYRRENPSQEQLQEMSEKIAQKITQKIDNNGKALK